MIIKLSGRNVDITEALRNQVYKKVGKLERYFNPDTEAQVTMTVENYRHIVEANHPFQRYCYPGRRRNRRYVCINRQGPG